MAGRLFAGFWWHTVYTYRAGQAPHRAEQPCMFCGAPLGVPSHGNPIGHWWSAQARDAGYSAYWESGPDRLGHLVCSAPLRAHALPDYVPA